MFDRDKLMSNLYLTLGKGWVDHVSAGLVAIVIAEVNGCYDSAQKVIFIDSRQSESDATQQLVMELSNHQNRDIFREIDAAGRSMSRDAYVERIEQLEHAGVQNVIRTYDAACLLELPWAKDGCVYGKMRGLSFAQYYQHVSMEHRERYGRRYDNL